MALRRRPEEAPGKVEYGQRNTGADTVTPSVFTRPVTRLPGAKIAALGSVAIPFA
jgi:hypothetical protein